MKKIYTEWNNSECFNKLLKEISRRIVLISALISCVLFLNAQTTFSSLGGVDSGGSGFKTVSTNSNIVVSNVMINDGSDMYTGVNKSQFTIKANGVDDFTFTDLNLYYFGSPTASNTDALSTVKFYDKNDDLIQTMSLNANKEFPTSSTSLSSFFDNGTTTPISGVAYIVFDIKTVAQYNTSSYTYENITINTSPTGSAPTVATQAVSDIASTTATGNGTITDLGGVNVTERGIYYSTTDGFADGAGTKVSATGTWSSTGAFTQAITGLTAETTYYLKAFATNSAGTSYGSQVSFTTSAASSTCTITSNDETFSSGFTTPTVTWNVGNSFTACQDGIISKIKVLSVDSQTGVTMKVYEGNGVGGNLLQTITGIALNGAGSITDYTVIDVSSYNIPVTNGSQYTFYFSDAKVRIYFNQTSSMLAGGAYWVDDGGVQEATTRDLYFEIDFGQGASNTAPTAASFTASPIYEGTPYAFAATNFGYSDGDSDPIDHVRVTAVPTNGTLWVDADGSGTVNGAESALTNNGTISKANLDAGYLKYLNTNGTSSSFTFDVNDGTDYSASTYTATLTVTAEPSVTLSLTPSLSIAENGGTTNVQATLSHSFDKTVTVNLSKTGTTIASDYTLSASSISITAGNTTNTVTITGQNDALDEDNETVILDISSVTNGLESGTQQVTCTITDDDAAPTVTFTAASQSSTNETGTMTVTAQLSAVSGKTVSVPFTVNGSSTATGSGTDYSISASPLTISAGASSANITITIATDAMDENNETVIVDMGTPTNATQGTTTTHTATITDDDTAPTVSFTAASQSSTNETGTMTVTAQLSAVSGKTVTVPFTVNGSSTATGSGTDYSISASPLTISAGASSANITITIATDAMDENNETVIVDMGTPTNATQGATTTHTATITDDDDQPTVSFTAASQSSTNETGSMTITAQLSGASGKSVTVPFSVNGASTATGSGTDYSISASPLTINAGATSANITITIATDALDEPNETVIVNMGTPTNATLGATTTHTATITDDDNPPTVSFTAASQSSTNETGTMTVTAQLSGASGKSVTVPFSVNGASTATGSGTDYSISASPLTINAGATSANITITIATDALDEPNETVIVNMGTPTNATLGATTTHTATITDDDNPPTVSFTAASQSSTNETGTMTVTAQLSGASGKSVTVPFSVNGASTATGSGTDYSISASPLTINAGATSANITITIATDALDEPNETVIVNMGAPTNAALGATITHTATITDDDDPPTVSFTAASQSSTNETGSMTITAQLSGASGKSITVPFSVNGASTATGSGTDYSISASPLTINAGATSANITITIATDALDEPNETVIVNMGAPTNAALGATITHTATITDDDDQPTVSFTAASQSSTNETGTMTITAQLSGASGKSVTVPFTVNGASTATGSGTDYSISASPLTINAGATSANITITIATDALDEPNETVIVNMGTPTNATQGSITTHTATITDDDDPPTVSFTAAWQSSTNETGSMTITAQLSGASAKSVTVPFTVNGASTATGSGTDYSISASPLTINAGATSANITITIATDALDEPNETVIVNMGTPINAALGATTTHTATITDDDNSPTVSFTAASQSSTNETGTMTITAQLSGASGKSITVPFTVNGASTATGGGTDYSISASPLTINAGSTSATVTITIAIDALLEANETVVVDMGTPINAVKGTTATHTATITDDETATAATSATTQGDETGPVSIQYTVTLSKTNNTGSAITFDFNTADGTATAGSDYTAVSGGTVSVANGASTGTFNVSVLDDALLEATETVDGTISNSSNAAVTISTATVSGNIVDNDTASVTIADVTACENGGLITLTATLDNPVQGGFSVDVSTSDGTATIADNDYAAVIGQTLTFAGTLGETQTFTVSPTADSKSELNETVYLSQSNLALTTLNINISDSAKITINNDDDIAVCKNITVYLDDSGAASIDSLAINNGTVSLCEIESYELDISSFDCSNTGTNTVIMTVTDVNSNISNCSATVTVADTISPAASCKNITVYLDGAGNASIDSLAIDNSSSDNCSLASHALDVSSFDCSDVGPNTVTMTVTDVDSNTSTCSATVTVSDTISPTASCKNITVYLDGSGTASIDSLAIDNGSGDNCSLASHALDISSFDCSDVGANTVTMTVTDVNSNTATCSATVTVSDTISPTASCKNITVYLDGSGNASIDSLAIDNSSSDNCSLASHALDVSSFDCSDVGDNTVTMTVADVNSNTATCVATVTVENTDSPTAACSDITLYLDVTGQVFIDSLAIDNGSTNNCGPVSHELDVNSFDCSDLGINSVTMTVTNENDYTATCTANVAVEDTISPTAICKDITVYLDGSGISTIDSLAIDNGSSDNCSLAWYALDVNSFDCSDVGSNAVTMTVVDVSRNTASCTATVTVEDTVPPTAVCKDITVYLDGAGTASIDSLAIDNGSDDNCSLASHALDISSFDCNDVGANTVTLTVADVNSNMASCTAIVTVADTISPTATCKDITVYLDGSGTASIDSMAVDNGSSDNCSLASHALDVSSFDSSDVGANTVTMTVTDLNSNTATCSATVTVSDTISPMATCKNITVYLDGSGSATIDSLVIDNGSSDNCSLASHALDVSSFDCSDVGANTVTMTVTDVNSNTATCSATVTVSDTISPKAVCKDITVYLDGSGNATIDSLAIDNSSSDKCSLASHALDISSFDCSDVGANTVTMTVTDVNSNTSTCSATVTVSDTISPTAVCKDITVYLDGSGSATIDSLAIDNNSSDNCSLALHALDVSSFDCGDVGVNTVTMTVTDVNSNSATCSATVTVSDTISPTAVCKDITVYLDGTGNATIDSLAIDNSSSDNCSLASHALDVSSFDCSDVGANTVTMTVTDVNSNTSTCSATVTVSDTISPTAVCKDITVYLDDSGSATIDSLAIDNGSSDNCSLASHALDVRSFNGSDLGVNTVTLTVTDIYSNTASCIATVTVEDTISPEVNCNSIEVLMTDTDGYELSAEDIVKLGMGSSDNVTPFDSLLIDVNPSAFSCSQAGGAVNVKVTVADEAGNQSTCETQVYIGYNIEVDLPDLEVTLEAGQCETEIDYPSVFTKEWCAELTLLSGLGPDGVFPLGTTIETWEVAMGSITETVSFSVVVHPVSQLPTLDSIADVITAEDEPIQLELTGISDGGDCLTQELMVSAESLNSDLIEAVEVKYEQGSSTAELSVTFVANQSGEAEVVVLVEEELGASVSDTFIVSVEPANDAPVLLFPIADGMLQAGDAISITLSKELGEVFTDVDGDELLWTFMPEGDTTYSWINASDPASEFVLTFEPTRGDTGCYTIIVQVSDPSGATARDTFEVCVSAIPVGISDFNESAFNVSMYPNPSRGLVTIEMQTSQIGEAEISVTNVGGAEVFRRKYNTGEHIQLDLSENVSGMYLIRITQDGKQVIKKLILDKN